MKPVLPVLLAAMALLPVMAAAPRPNIVLINCDDLDFDESELWDFYDYRKFPSFTGAEMLGYKHRWLPGLSYRQPMLTPHIRSLAEEGAVFERFYMTSSMCTPSRYSLMTGQYASRSPVLEKHFGKTAPAGFQLQSDLAPGQWTVATGLRQAGYKTGLVGKWHLLEGGSPARGFVVPSLRDADARDPQVAARVREVYDMGVEYIKANHGFDYVGSVYQHNANGLGLPKGLIRSEHHVEWQTHHAKQFIDRHHDRPFFLYFAPSAPHGWYGADPHLGDPMDMPIEATLAGYSTEHIGSQPSREDVLRRIAERKIDRRNAMATWLDDSIGEVLKKLDEYGLKENTLVILTSDHQSRGKFSVTEGCRVPFVARWPGRIAPGSRCGQLMANIDMVPTFLDLAGARPPEGMPVDGLDMARIFRGETDRTAPRDLLLEIGYMRAVVSGDWKYCALRLPEGGEPKRDIGSWTIARQVLAERGKPVPAADAPLTAEELACVSYDGRIYYDRFTGGVALDQGPDRTFPHYADRDQLYNLDADPYEQRNLFDNPECNARLQEMQGRLKARLDLLPRAFGEFKAP